MSLIGAKKFDEVINFAKEINKLIVITRQIKGQLQLIKMNLNVLQKKILK